MRGRLLAYLTAELIEVEATCAQVIACVELSGLPPDVVYAEPM